MRHTEIKKAKKPYKYSQEISFFMKFTDTDNPDYKFHRYFIQKNNVQRLILLLMTRPIQ
jgi:hypothetical protein